MGGDGTINEVVNGFFAEGGDHAPLSLSPEAAFGVLPAGTGGDFIRTTGTSRQLAAAARALASARPRAIDVGRLSFVADDGRPAVRHFINIASFGISGLVDRYVNRSSKVLGGRASFFLSTARASLAYRNPRCRITVDDGAPVEQGIYNVAVANGRYFGGGMKVAPDAVLDDGRFDVVTIGDAGFVTMLTQGTRIYSGTHLSLDFVHVARGKKVLAEPLGLAEVLLDVDGEAPGRLPATFEILPGGIQLRA
jgi:YegS/Rv2252/BmrU family lipid kinase